MKFFIHTAILIFGNILILSFSFAADSTRYFALIGFIIVLYSIFILPGKLCGLITKNEISIFDISSGKTKKDKTLKKGENIVGFSLLFLIFIHIYGFYSFYKYQKQLLSKNGVEVKAIIHDKQWRHYRNSSGKYYIYYSYKYKGKIYRQNEPNSFYNIGDTIQIRLLPNNPNNHEIIIESNTAANKPS